MAVSKERVAEIIEYSLEHTEDEACKAYSIPMETFNRYKREYKKHFGENAELFMSLRKQYSKEELKAIASGGRPSTIEKKKGISLDFEGEEIVFGVIADTHFGSIYSPTDYLSSAIREFEKQNCDFIVHAGDVTEGMSGRPGHVYELSDIGYKAQRDVAIKMMSEWKKKWYVISGNHDCWYLQKADIGADIVQDICERLPDASYLGIHEGDINIKGVIIRLWHGQDGSSYAHSYRLQQVLASLDVEDIPDIMIAGHCHKSGYFFDRGCHTIAAGTLQDQSGFMRYKRLPAHVGFYIIRMKVQEGKLISFSPTYYPIGGH